MGLLDLFRPKWKHSDMEVRLAKVMNLTNMAALAWVVENDKEWNKTASSGRTGAHKYSIM